MTSTGGHSGSESSLSTQLAELKAQNSALLKRLADLEATRSSEGGAPGVVSYSSPSSAEAAGSDGARGTGHEAEEEGHREVRGKAGLTAGEIARYSRHLLVPGVGVEGQRNVLKKTCLIIGAGGLASAVLPYLAGAGVGHIKIVDFDTVETSNLHRQVMFREDNAGKSKAQCATRVARGINSTVRCTAIEEALTHDNALEVMASCDLVVDASDNPRTRYLVNDACVLLGKPLVSGSALGMEGQVSVFNFRGGPCYRCVFPEPLAAEAGRRCSDNGVLGTVPGVIGCLQATEALKVLGGFGEPLSGKLCTYDAQDGSFYTVRLRPRLTSCAACGDKPIVTNMKDSEVFALQHSLTVERLVPQGAWEEELPTTTCEEYASFVASRRPHVLLDVRVRVQFAVCALNEAVNVPLAELERFMDKVEIWTRQKTLPLFCICRRGMDSRAAVSLLLKKGFTTARDVKGGLVEWSRVVDRHFPMY